MEALPRALQTTFRQAMEENKYFEWKVKGKSEPGKTDSLEVILTWTKLETGPLDRNIPATLQIVIDKAHDKYQYFEWFVHKHEGMTEMFLIWKDKDEGTHQYVTRRGQSEQQQNRHQEDQKFQILVEDLSANMYIITVEKKTLIENVKDILYSVKGMPTDQQRLVFARKQLEDGRSLADYNIGSLCTMHLLTRLRGD